MLLAGMCATCPISRVLVPHCPLHNAATHPTLIPGGDFHSRTALGMYDHIKEAIDKGGHLGWMGACSWMDGQDASSGAACKLGWWHAPAGQPALPSA